MQFGVHWRILSGGVSTPAYLGPVTSTYTVRNTERYPFSILPFGVTAMRAAVGRLQVAPGRTGQTRWKNAGELASCNQSSHARAHNFVFMTSVTAASLTVPPQQKQCRSLCTVITHQRPPH